MHGSKRDVADLLHLSRGQRLSKRQFAINGIQVAPEIGQLLSNGFAGHFCGISHISDNLSGRAGGKFGASFRPRDHGGHPEASRRFLWPH